MSEKPTTKIDPGLIAPPPPLMREAPFRQKIDATFKTTEEIVTPDYYTLDVDGYEFSAMDVIEALDANFNIGCAVKYLIRQGRKPNTPATQDLKKAIDCIHREIRRQERE